ncbi:MAG: DUF1858 domain-containing protein [Nitrospirota bacterium]|nr:DUF1858 domain-containing protein [Nitrospirota bacterium]
MQITKDMNVRKVLTQYPQTLEVFIRRGFTPMKNPVLRFVLTRLVTIEQAAKKHNLPLEPLLEELNKVVQPS